MAEIERDNTAAFLARHQQAHGRAVQRVLGLMRRNAPVDMGRLRGSLTNRPVLRTDTRSVDMVGSALRYARIRELGGVIVPVRAKRLVWRDKAGGWHSATRVVQRPGGPSNGYRPYGGPAVAQYPRIMAEEVRR